MQGTAASLYIFQLRAVLLHLETMPFRVIADHQGLQFIVMMSLPDKFLITATPAGSSLHRKSRTRTIAALNDLALACYWVAGPLLGHLRRSLKLRERRRRCRSTGDLFLLEKRSRLLLPITRAIELHCVCYTAPQDPDCRRWIATGIGRNLYHTLMAQRGDVIMPGTQTFSLPTSKILPLRNQTILKDIRSVTI